MCEHESGHHEHHAAESADETPKLRRRQLLRTAVLAVPGAAAVARGMGTAPAAAAGVDGAFSMAMHLHTSFSEGYGSMAGHLSEAVRNGVDVVWWTDHDVNLAGIDAKSAVHFTSLTGEVGDGPAWQWTQTRTGSLTAASGGGIVDAPDSPRDPVSGGSLHVVAQGTGTAAASVVCYPSYVPGRATWRSTLAGQTVSFELLPQAVGRGGYFEFRLVSSYHPARGGRSAGQYTLSYRIRPGATPGRRSTDRLGVVDLPCTLQQWGTVTLRPEADLAALFPDLDARDFSLHAFRMVAVSVSRALVEGCFDYLRFTRPNAGEASVRLQRELMASYTTTYPGVLQRLGVEVSHYRPHVNWYGGNVTLPAYVGVSPKNYFDYVRQTIVPDIHAAGGLASYNHPFGVSTAPLLPAAAQDDLQRQLALQLLPVRACGTDILEVGYPRRGQVDLAHHVGLWDVFSRNAVFLTGNGVSDDHAGTNWERTTIESWLTSVWASNRGESSLLGALRSGRAWCAALTKYRGGLDLTVDALCPMGSVSVSRLNRRALTVTATDLPAGARLEVVQGAVDYAGTSDPVPTSRVVARIPSESLVAGQQDMAVDTGSSSFVRTQVRNSAGEVVALSNPVWLLREAPPRGVPAHRIA